MKKFKKIVFGIIIITTIAIAICSNISLGTSSTSKYTKAQFHSRQAPKPTGTKYTLNGEDAAILYSNVYCIDYNDPLKWETYTYDVKYKVEFRGTKASFYNTVGNLVWESTTENNATVGAILTPNSLVSTRALVTAATYLGAMGNSVRLDSFSMYSSYEEALEKEYGEVSGAQSALWQIIKEGWLNYCERNGGIKDIDYSGREGADIFYAGVDPYANSRWIGQLCTLNVDVYILHNDSQQDLFLVYPYGENLPEEEPDVPVIPEEPEEPDEPDIETTNIKVTKKWEDENNRDGKRPNKITVKLYADGVEYRTANFGGTGNEWTYQFTNVPIKNEDGNYIAYTVEEEVINGYEATINHIYEE